MKIDWRAVGDITTAFDADKICRWLNGIPHLLSGPQSTAIDCVAPRPSLYPIHLSLTAAGYYPYRRHGQCSIDYLHLVPF